MPGSPFSAANGRPVGMLRLVLAAVVLSTAATAFATPVAHAGDPGPSAIATIRAVDPAIPAPGDDLVLAGAVANTGDEPLRDVNVILRYSAVPLDDRAQIRQIASDEELRYGRRYADYFQPVATELEPGQTVAYRLVVPIDEIDFGAPGVYVVGVDVRASPADGERLTLDTARTVVPWLPTDQPLAPVPVALLWPLATQPAVLPDGSLIDDGMAARLAADGPLTTLVNAPGSAPVTWVVDPDLLATVDTMAGGYTVTAPDGTTSDGLGAADAGIWRDAFAAATTGDQVLLLPYADPDLPAIAHDDEGEALDTARAALADTRAWLNQAGRTGTGEISWPGSGVADDATLAALAAAGARTVVLSGDAVSPEPTAFLAEVQAGEATMAAVIADGGLQAAIDGGLVASDPPAGATTARQAWLAETAMVSLSADAGSDVPEPLVAAPPAGWQPSAAVAAAVVEAWTATPWVRPTTLADLPAPARPVVVEPDPEATAAPPELPPATVEAASALRRDSARYAALLAEPDPLTDDLRTAALRAVATTWRSTPDAAATYTATATAEVTTRLDQVSVLIPDSVTLSGEEGTFPLTVSNGLPQPVLVTVDVRPGYPDRLSVAAVPPQRVNAAENATVEVTAQAAANGKVPVTVQLTAADGSPLGPPQQMIVNATDYGTIGWAVVVAAVALFLAAAVLRIVRARRRPVEPAFDVAVPAEPEPLRETAR
jgi:Family of unknown function (DUF6049)